MLQEGSFPSQEVDYKSATQLKTKPPTEILQKPHPDLVLEIHEHLFFKKLTLNGCLFSKKRRRRKKTVSKKS